LIHSEAQPGFDEHIGQETPTEVDQEALEKLRQSAVPADRPRKPAIPVNLGLSFVPH
jgi:hypothetical protein